MPEPDRCTERWRAGPPHTAGGVTLLAIERIVTRVGMDGARAWASVAREPYAIVVLDRGEIHATGTDGLAMAPDRLPVAMADLKVLLSSQ